jgi:hypothetical protein
MTAICRVVKFVLRQSLGLGQDTSVKLVPAVQINNKEIAFACNATSPMSYGKDMSWASQFVLRRVLCYMYTYIR